MHAFVVTVSILGPIVLAIMVLAVFFRLLRWASGRLTPGTARLAVRGVFDGTSRVTVRLSDRTALEGVRVIGTVDPKSTAMPFPYSFNEMLVLEQPDGAKVMIRAKQVRSIEVPPARS